MINFAQLLSFSKKCRVSLVRAHLMALYGLPTPCVAVIETLGLESGQTLSVASSYLPSL